MSPDISKCANNRCPLRDRCYRFTSLPSDWQSYADFEFIATEEGVECEYFWDNGGYHYTQKDIKEDKSK
jgi:hypothetical protein